MLQTHQLKFSYDTGPTFDFPDFEATPARPLLLLGNSGVGKTTLLHLLGGMLRPTSGSVSVEGTNLSHLKGAEIDKFRGENIGVIFQTAHFVSSLSVLENLLLPNYFVGKTLAHDKATQILTRLSLGHRADARPQNLSVGEKQRAAIARAVMNEPKLILADEPTSALDDDNATEVIALLQEQAKLAGAALVIVTHDQRLKDKFSNSVHL